MHFGMKTTIEINDELLANANAKALAASRKLPFAGYSRMRRFYACASRTRRRMTVSSCESTPMTALEIARPPGERTADAGVE